MITYDEIEKVAKRKIEIAFLDRELTDEQKSEYLIIFIDDIIKNLQFQNYTIRRGLTYEKVS